MEILKWQKVYHQDKINHKMLIYLLAPTSHSNLLLKLYFKLIIKKFLSEAQIRTLIVQKFIIKGKLHGGFFPTRYSNLTLIYPDPYFWKFFGHILLN